MDRSKKLQYVRSGLVLGTLVGSAGMAFGQVGSGGSLTETESFFTQSASPTTAAATPGVADVLRASATTDHLFYNWWWVRVNGVDTRENALFNATSWNWAGTTGTLNYTFPSFTVLASWTIHDTGENTVQVDTSLRISNTTAAPLSLAAFHGIDIDYGGSIGNDNVVLASPGLMTITDTVVGAPWNALPAFYAAEDANNYAVQAFGNVAAPRTLLVNTTVNDWADTGLPFLGDFTGSWQFNRTIPAGGSEVVTASFGIGTYVPPGGGGCPADLDNDGDFGNGGAPDGGVDINDLLYFLTGFEVGSVAVDLDNGSGTGTPDGGTDINDLLFFLVRFEAGC